MVHWNDKERGIRVEETGGVRGVYLGCMACQHSVTMELGEAKRRFAGLHWRDVAQRLRCTRCGRCEGYTMVWAFNPQNS